jgi:hypothetical protein
LVQELDDYIFPKGDIARPAVFVTLGKEECKDIAALSARIEAELQDYVAMRLLGSWEEDAIAAASDVVGELAAIASGQEVEPKAWREAWQASMLKLMYQCAAELVGVKAMSDGQDVFKAFCHSVIPLVGDRMESRVAAEHPDVAGAIEKFREGAQSGSGDAKTSARINAMLHCAIDDPGWMQAGCVYPLKAAGLGEYFPDVATMLRPLVAQGKRNEEDFNVELEDIADSVLPIALETSPSCDHVQGNRLVARLTGGFLVPEETFSKLKSSLPGSVWRLGPLWVAAEKGKRDVYYLYVNCLLVSSCPLKVLNSATPLFRMRSQAFAALQVSFGSHAARPGMLVLR